jgi:autotransporter-associated beta strand protein
LVFAGTNQYVGTLTAGRTYAFSGTGHHLVSGPILNSVNGAPISLIKSDTGTLTLAGTNTYGGTTTVSGGTLLVNGTLPSGGLTISSGVTLGGNGVINSAVTMPSGSTLSPGAILGRLTVNNNVSLQAGSTTRMEISKAADTNDVLRPNGSLSYGGTLVVTNLAGDLAPGDSFQLFQAASYFSSFAAFNLPPLNTGLFWDTTRLANGALAVVAVPPQITDVTRLSDGNFLFTGTGAAGLTYELRAATNLAPPIEWGVVTNAVADGNGISRFPDPGATNYPQRFYRVFSP